MRRDHSGDARICSLVDGQCRSTLKSGQRGERRTHATASHGTPVALDRQEGRHPRALAHACADPRAEARRGGGPHRRVSDQSVGCRADVRRRRPVHGESLRHPRQSGRHGEHPTGDDEGHGRTRGPVVAGRKRRRRRGGACRFLRRSPGADGQDRGDSRRRHVRAVPLHQGRPVPRLAAGHHAGGGRLVLREPAHRARHGRDHARGRPLRARAHGGGLEPRPDAEQDLHQGRHRTGEHRAQAGARGASRRRSAPSTWWTPARRRS